MAPKSSSSEAEYDFAAATGSSADIDDDFDWADDELPTATAAATSEQATAQPAAVAVKQGPIPVKAPVPGTSTLAAQPAAAAPGPAQGRPAAPAAGAQPAAAAAPKAPPASGAKPQVPAPKPAAPQVGPKPPLVRPPAPGAATAATAAAGKGPSATRQPAPPAAATAAASGAGKPAAAMPVQKAAPAGAAAGPKAALPVAPTATSSSSSSSSTAKHAVSAATAQTAAPAAAAAAAPRASQPDSSSAPNSATGGSPEIAPAPAAEAAAAPRAAANQAGSSSGADTGACSNNSSGGGSTKGWGGWLAPASLGGLSSKLQQVALGAAKDLQELTASVHQVVAEVVAADDITEVDRLAEYQPRPVRPHEGPTATAKPDAAPPAPVMASRDSSSQLKAPGAGPEAGAATGSPAAAADLNPEEVKRQEILQRLQGRDTQLESGLKVIDDQVDALAANAVKALGSLWGGLNTVAKTSWGLTTDITKKVEAAAKEMAKEVAVGLEEGTSLVARAEKGLESVLGRRVTSGGGSQRSAADWESTFESCFELYGGTTATDELEELSSECAHICNNARAKLQQQQREQIDAMLSKLVPLFDPTAILQQHEGPDAAAVAASAAVEAAGVQEATLDALDALYAPVVAACNKGKRKAAQLQSNAAQAAAAAAAAVAADSAASPPRQQQQQGPDGGAADSAHQAASSSTAVQQDTVLDPVLQEHQRVCDALREVLQGVRSAAVKSLAEVAAGQVMVLLTMAQSVAALPRYGKPLADGLEWPPDAEAVGGLIRGKVQEMVADTRELAAAFAAAADKVSAHMPPAVSTPTPAAAPAAAAGEGAAEGNDSKGGGKDSPAQQQQQQEQQSPQEVLQQRAETSTAEVNADCQMALTHVRDSHGKLLYVVLLASLHRAGKDAPAEQQQKQQEEEQQQQKKKNEQAAAVQEQSQQAREQPTQHKSD